MGRLLTMRQVAEYVKNVDNITPGERDCSVGPKGRPVSESRIRSRDPSVTRDEEDFQSFLRSFRGRQRRRGKRCAVYTWSFEMKRSSGPGLRGLGRGTSGLS